MVQTSEWSNIYNTQKKEKISSREAKVVVLLFFSYQFPPLETGKNRGFLDVMPITLDGACGLDFSLQINTLLRRRSKITSQQNTYLLRFKSEYEKYLNEYDAVK